MKGNRTLAGIMGVLLLAASVLSGWGALGRVAAQGAIIKEVQVEAEQIGHAETSKVTVKFGGQGTNVQAGQRVDISFGTAGAKVKLPSSPIPLYNREGQLLGEVQFSESKGTLIFNENAAKLDDVEGSFYFSFTGYYEGDMDQDGTGRIYIDYEGNRKTIEVTYKKGGTSTNNVYSKKGVEVSGNDGSSVDWVFTFNAARNQSDGSAGFVVTDKLPETMTWDLDKINSSPYVVQFQGGYLPTLFPATGGWVDLQKAKEMGIGISFAGQDLTITIPGYANYGGGYTATLHETEVAVRLSAKITRETLENEAVEYVENTSEPVLNGADWTLDPTQFGDRVKIQRQGGSISGTKPGELQIKKVIKGTQIPVKDVEFTLTRKDGQDIQVKEGDGYVNKGPSVRLTTNDQGMAEIKGLKAQTYEIRETKAPQWIAYDQDHPVVREFEMKADDKVGAWFLIENDKKKTEVSVEKKWIKADGQPGEGMDTKVRLYQNDLPVSEEVTLTKEKTSHIWRGLDLTDDQGNSYRYTVKEVGEENGEIEIGGKQFQVTYGKAENGSLVITNKQEEEMVPLVPATTEIKVTKVWRGVSSDKAPEITVYLFKNGEKIQESLKLNQGNQWTGSFENLPVVDHITDTKANTYSVKEEPVFGYRTEISGTEKDGFTITNTITGKRSVPVTKKWVGRPGTSATIRLLADGREVDSVVLREENHWQHTFTDLEQYQDGKEIAYTIQEEEEKGYETKITGDMETGFTVTNTRKEPKQPILAEPSPKKTSSSTSMRTPKTGEQGHSEVYVGALLASLGGIWLLRRKK